MNGKLTAFADNGRHYYRLETERGSTHQSGSYESPKEAISSGRLMAKNLGVTITSEVIEDDELAPVDLREHDNIR